MSAFDKLNSYDIFTKPGAEAVSLGDGHVCLKRTIMGVNLFFLILGIALAAVGGAGSSNLYAKFSGAQLTVGILVIGIFIILMSLLGCVGAKMESPFLLGFYAVVVIILVICQISVGLALYSQIGEIDSLITKAWDSGTNGDRVFFQDLLVCCGLTVYNQSTDRIPNFNPATMTATGLAGQPCPAQTVASLQTCLVPMRNAVQSQYTTASVVAIVFAFLQILGCSFTFCLIRGIKLAREQDLAMDMDTPAEIAIANVNANSTGTGNTK